jgi:D-3-phosphoglycerate dehydrogenase
MMSRILIADPLDPSGLELLKASGVELHQLTAEERPRLTEVIADYDALVVRSMTQVTAELLAAGKKLKVVGRAGIGVDNVDVEAATERGILVVNAPTANLMSATEHTFALLLAVARNVPAADASMKAGVWDRKSFLGVELQGKTLGVIGFGRIGQRVAARARGFEMQVVAFDPFLDEHAARRLEVELLSIEALLARADVVTLHTPLTEQTRNLLSRERIAGMKPGALLVNCGRGGVVDEEALLAALESGRLGGAGLDVFSEEPPKDLRLVRHPKVVATPHIGAQTREAQERISKETAEMLLAALAGSLAVAAVNLPFRPTGSRVEPYLALAERLGKMAGQLLEGAPQQLGVELWGIEEAHRVPVSLAALKGVLSNFLGEGVNYVNADRIAESRGIQVVRSTHSGSGDYPHLIGVRLTGGGKTVELDGTLFGDRDPRVVRFGGFRLEFRPEGKLLVLENRDLPGVVGRLGTLLGEAGVNIADIHLARREEEPGGGAMALAVLRLDQNPPDEVVTRLLAIPEVQSAHRVDLGGGRGSGSACS